jgi:hypothetical protein
MNCHQINENLSAFIDNELTPDDTNAIKAHLIRCSGCRQQRDKMENLGRKIRHMTPLTAPEDFQFRVYARIHKHEANRSNRFFWRWQTIMVPAACLLLGIFLGISSDTILGRPDSTQFDASDQIGLADSNLAMIDQNTLYDYHLGAFSRGVPIPITGDTIPDSPDGFSRPSRREQREFDTRAMPPSQYVLDHVPTRVNYERTIY